MSTHTLADFPLITDEPLRIAVRRSGAVESIHEVDIALCDAQKDLLLGMGNTDGEIFHARQ